MKKITNFFSILLISCMLITSEPFYASTIPPATIFYVTDQLVVDKNTITPLYNPDDNLIAFYFEGVNNGYAIFSTEGDLIEYSDVTNIEEYTSEEDNICYYNGPCEHYWTDSPNNQKIYSCENNTSITKESLDSFDVSESDVSSGIIDSRQIKVYSRKKSATITYPDNCTDGKKRTFTTKDFSSMVMTKKKNLPYATRNFSYNTNNNCGSTAAAIFIYYYYDHISTSYITKSQYKKYESALVTHFRKDLIQENGGGSNYPELKSGINKYLAEINKSKSCKYIYRSSLKNPISKIESCIDAQRPCIIGTYNDPVFSDHWLVGVGYLHYTAYSKPSAVGNFTFIKANCGWYTQKIVYINSAYIDGVVYI